MSTINEYQRDALAHHSEIYKQVYDILEKNTFSWVTDAWKQQPLRSSIKIEELEPTTETEALDFAERNNLNTKKALRTLQHRNERIVLRVGKTSCLITRKIARSIMEALNE